MESSFLYSSAKSMTHPGKRVNNEDYADYIEPTEPEEYLCSGCLYIVADGVGGASFGEMASQHAVRKVLHDYYQPSGLSPRQKLEKAILAANADIYTYSHSVNNEMQMATTMVAALIVNNQLIVANAGDSPAYLIRNGQIEQLSEDHSLVGELIRSGTITDNQTRTARVRNQLTRSLGAESNVKVHFLGPECLRLDDRIVLCSDGVTRYADPLQILRLAGSGTAEDAANKMVDFAIRQGGVDNITALVITMETSNLSEKSSQMKTNRSVDAISEMVTDVSGLSFTENDRKEEGDKKEQKQGKRMDIYWQRVNSLFRSKIFRITLAIALLAALILFVVYHLFFNQESLGSAAVAGKMCYAHFPCHCGGS